jgi:hypothetical protein
VQRPITEGGAGRPEIAGSADACPQPLGDETFPLTCIDQTLLAPSHLVENTTADLDLMTKRGELNLCSPQPTQGDVVRDHAFCCLVSFWASDTFRKACRLCMIVRSDAGSNAPASTAGVAGLQGTVLSEGSFASGLSGRCVRSPLWQTTRARPRFISLVNGIEVHCCVGRSQHRVDR